MKILYLLIIFALFFASPVWGQDENGTGFRGKVLDIAGLPVAGAEITLNANGGTTTCRSGNQGIFSCKLGTAQRAEITIRANGFSILRQMVVIIQDVEALPEFYLEPETLKVQVVVDILKTKTSVDESPASIQSINKEEIQSTASTTIDGVLRQSVGFSLFRRTESTTANPTTQGASLRGVNSSGASRSKILSDGIPIDDPFGGWVVWGRIPKASLQRIEVLRGGGASIYGSGAIGGTVDLITREASENGFAFSGELGLGTSKTFDGSSFFGLRKNDWSADLVISTFQTRGYRIVDRSVRGPVDDFANSRNTNGSIRLRRQFGRFSSVFGRAAVFGEGRNNGTPVQKNRTHIRDFAIGGDFAIDGDETDSGNNRLLLTVFGSTQVFDQSFSAVSADRTTENLVRFQRVPAQRTGFSGRFVTQFFQNSINAGFETTETRGSSNETGFFGGNATSQTGSGGREKNYSIFVNDFARVTRRLVLSGSIRYERRRNFRSLRTARSLSMNTVTTTVFADRSQGAWSPGGAFLFNLTKALSIYGSAAKTFRAPTLNELYRGFRVGNIITNPNEFLLAEKALNTEGGVKYSKSGFYLSSSVFRTSVSNAVSNVTIDPGPPLIIRQRQNAGITVTQGLEIEAEYRGDKFGLKSGFLFIDARVSEFDSNPLLIGNRIPQVPQTQFTFQTYFNPNNDLMIAFQGRASSAQFDDDTNNLELESYFRGDLFVSGRIRGRLRVFAAIENIFNSRYSVGRTPVRTISSPFSFRAGLRFD